MGTPIRSRLLDYIDHIDPGPGQGSRPGPGHDDPEPRRSRLLDYVDQGDPVETAPPSPRPGIPAYHTPVFVPAHPRYVETSDDRDGDTSNDTNGDTAGTPTRVPFIAYELFAHPTDGTVALAFTTLAGLVAALGEAQPWVATSLGPLAEGVGALGVTVRLDPRLAPGPPNWRPADLAAYAREVA